MSDQELEDKVAIVTGSSRNIGRAIAHTLAAAGAKVVINARKSERQARETAKAIVEAGGSAMVAMGDVTGSAEVADMVSTVLQQWGRIDILVNNANVHGVKAFE